MCCIDCDFDFDLQNSIHNKMHEFREPCYSAALTIALPEVIKKHIHLNNCTVEISSSYIHQKPMVRYVADKKGGARHNVKVKRCEVGDLMIIVSRKVGQQITCNSVIFQLKKGENHVIAVDQTQLDLYTRWPTFWLEDKITADKDFVIGPHEPHSGAMYMIINQPDDRNVIPCRFLISFPRQCISLKHLRETHSCLGSYLASVIEGCSGRAIYSEERKHEDDWSDLVWTILQNIENYKMNCQGVNIVGGTNRSASAVIRMLTVNDAGKILGCTNPEWLYEDNRSDNEDTWNDGFGMIRINIEERD